MLGYYLPVGLFCNATGIAAVIEDNSYRNRRRPAGTEGTPSSA
jgi:hypothetical protein